MKKKSPKREGQILRGVVYRLIESLASMGHSSLWKLICAISVCNTLTVGVHLSSTPGISGPGSATDCRQQWNMLLFVLHVRIQTVFVRGGLFPLLVLNDDER